MYLCPWVLISEKLSVQEVRIMKVWLRKFAISSPELIIPKCVRLFDRMSIDEMREKYILVAAF